MTDDVMADLAALAARRAVVRLDDGAHARLVFAPRPGLPRDPTRKRRFSRRTVRVQMFSGKYLSVSPERIAHVLDPADADRVVALLNPNWKD